MSTAAFDVPAAGHTLAPAAYRDEDFPGCESFHLPASELDHYEYRLESRGPRRRPPQGNAARVTRLLSRARARGTSALRVDEPGGHHLPGAGARDEREVSIPARTRQPPGRGGAGRALVLRTGGRIAARRGCGRS